MALLIGVFSTSLFASPQWFNHIPKEKGFIIGIGVGKSIVEAKQSAMTDIGNTLYSNVSSRINNKVKVHNQQVDTQFISTKLVSSENVLLPKVSWEKLDGDEDNNYYAMARVKISEVVALYEKTLNLQLNQFDNLLNKENLTLSEYLQLRASENELKVAAQRAASISNLSKKAKINFYQIMSLFSKQNQFIGSVCFNVKESHDRLANKNYLPVIESAVQADKFKLKKSATCIPIKFRAKTEKTKEAGKKIANVTMQLTLGSPSIASNIIKFKGQSDGSYTAAMLDAADQFSAYFHTRKGLLNTLLQTSDKTIVIN